MLKNDKFNGLTENFQTLNHVLLNRMSDEQPKMTGQLVFSSNNIIKQYSSANSTYGALQSASLMFEQNSDIGITK